MRLLLARGVIVCKRLEHGCAVEKRYMKAIFIVRIRAEKPVSKLSDSGSGSSPIQLYWLQLKTSEPAPALAPAPGPAPAQFIVKKLQNLWSRSGSAALDIGMLISKILIQYSI